MLAAAAVLLATRPAAARAVLYGELCGGGYPHAITEAEASVACRQLGNELGYELSSSSKIDRANTDDGSGKAYLIACAGTEASLDSCASFEYVTWASSNHM